MNILYIGAGFVGTCSAAVSANSGHKNLVFDIDTDKIKKLNSQDRAIIEATLFEDGLGDLLIRNKERIDFTSEYGEVENFLNDCQAIFLCVPTPEIDGTGESNLTYYFSALEKLSHSLVNRNKGKQTNYVVVVNKSTVPIDVIVQTEEVLEKAGVKNYGVVSNPEFLVEGKAIQESLKPDRIVIGAKKEQDFVVMRQIYQRFYDAPTVQYIEVGPEEAAAGKLLANFYLFNKLALCFDVLGRTCEAFDNLKIENIRRILTTDKRIGEWGFYDSLYAGGSCFIKDARSLAHQLQTKGYEATLVNETHLANKRQLELFIARATKEAGINWSDKKVAVLGLSFKRDTNDIRNTPSIEVVNFLMEQSVEHISLYDPIANDVFKKQFPPSEKIGYSTNIDEAVQDAEVIIITTDWPQFRELAAQLMHLKNKPLLMDGRRMLQHRYNELQEMGFDIIAVGSPFIKGLTK
jgi:UDPglucose 6-dehydrogenase